MKLFDLSGRVAVVTGGNGGIGLGMARGLAQAGAAIVVAARDEAKNVQAIAELTALRAEAAAVSIDITDEGSCEAMVQTAIDRFGRLDILINNAGTTVRKQPEEFTIEEWETVLGTNLTGVFLCAQAAYPQMCEVGGGKIINIGSMMSLFGSPFAAPYAASKGGVVQLTKSLATSWAKDNIQVNAVLPGWIDTEMTRNARAEVEGLHQRVEARTPAGHWGHPDSHSGIAVFLASPASDFVTGTAIPVDGGYSAQL